MELRFDPAQKFADSELASGFRCRGRQTESLRRSGHYTCQWSYTGLPPNLKGHRNREQSSPAPTSSSCFRPKAPPPTIYPMSAIPCASQPPRETLGQQLLALACPSVGHIESAARAGHLSSSASGCLEHRP